MAAIDRDGTEHVARSPHTGRCTGLNARGLPCGAWPLRGQDVCYRHSMTDEEWLELSQSGGRARVRNLARAKAHQETSVPLDAHAEALRRLREAEERLHDLHRQGRISANELPRSYRRLSPLQPVPGVRPRGRKGIEPALKLPPGSLSKVRARPR